MAEFQNILICSDLDRTIIPNGYQEESAHCRPVLRRLAAHSAIHLAYVSGRGKKLILDAIEDYDLPMPDYAIGDVGTTLYRIIDGNWQICDDWSREIGKDWRGLNWQEVADVFGDIEKIRLQEPEKQSRHKLSFYTDPDVDHQQLIKIVRFGLTQKRVSANVIWSMDEISANGLLDIIPARANKLHAIRFLLQQEQFSEDRVVFAGDSGNDLDVLTSGLQAILVKNAMDEVRKEAIEVLAGKQLINRLYLPEGNFLGMNGNYAAGLLEGLAYFMPETEKLVVEAAETVNSTFDGDIRKHPY